MSHNAKITSGETSPGSGTPISKQRMGGGQSGENKGPRPSRKEKDDLLRGADADLPASSSQPKRKRDAKILASPVKRTTHESEDDSDVEFVAEVSPTSPLKPDSKSKPPNRHVAIPIQSSMQDESLTQNEAPFDEFVIEEDATAGGVNCEDDEDDISGCEQLVLRGPPYDSFHSEEELHIPIEEPETQAGLDSTDELFPPKNKRTKLTEEDARTENDEEFCDREIKRLQHKIATMDATPLLQTQEHDPEEMDVDQKTAKDATHGSSPEEPPNNRLSPPATSLSKAAAVSSAEMEKMQQRSPQPVPQPNQQAQLIEASPPVVSDGEIIDLAKSNDDTAEKPTKKYRLIMQSLFDYYGLSEQDEMRLANNNFLTANFVYSFVREAVAKSGRRDVALCNPTLVSDLAKVKGVEENILETLGASFSSIKDRIKFVYIIICDASHFVLGVAHRSSQTLYMYNSMNSIEIKPNLPLLKVVTKLFFRIGNVVAVESTTQQHNSYDCGLHVILNARASLANPSDTDPAYFPEERLDNLRVECAETLDTWKFQYVEPDHSAGLVFNKEINFEYIFVLK